MLGLLSRVVYLLRSRGLPDLGGLVFAVLNAVSGAGCRIVGRAGISRSGSVYLSFRDRHGCRFVVRIADHVCPGEVSQGVRHVFDVLTSSPAAGIASVSAWVRRQRVRPLT